MFDLAKTKDFREVGKKQFRMGPACYAKTFKYDPQINQRPVTVFRNKNHKMGTEAEEQDLIG